MAGVDAALSSMSSESLLLPLEGNAPGILVGGRDAV